MAYKLPEGRVTVAEASAELLVTQLTLRYLMANNIEPYDELGVVKNCGCRRQFIIYRNKLEDVKKQLKI